MKILPLLLSLVLLCGCGHNWTSNNYGSPEEAKKAFPSVKNLCQDYSRETQAINYGFDRYSRVDQPLQDTANYMHNYYEDMTREDIFEKCMRDRGWQRD